MGEIVVLVVAAAWAAVLIPPLLRSRIENRPNSSVTDFRRQLNKLQSTVPSRASGPMRGMARPLAPSPLQRPAAGGRPGVQPAHFRRGGTRTHGGRASAGTIAPPRDVAASRRRSHGDPTGSQPRPRLSGHRQAQFARHSVSSSGMMRRRRSNMVFMFVVVTGSTLFLAATTKAPAMLYLFAASFLGLCGYLYLLSQARQRETTAWPSDWMHHR